MDSNRLRCYILMSGAMDMSLKEVMSGKVSSYFYSYSSLLEQILPPIANDISLIYSHRYLSSSVLNRTG